MGGRRRTQQPAVQKSYGKGGFSWKGGGVVLLSSSEDLKALLLPKGKKGSRP